MFVFPLKTFSDLFVSDYFEDGIIDPKWNVQILDGPGTVTEKSGLLDLKLYFDSIIDTGYIKVTQLMPEIIQNNFHQNDNDYFALNLKGIPYWDSLVNGTTRAKGNFKIDFTTGDIQIVFFFENKGIYTPKLNFIALFNDSIIGRSSCTSENFSGREIRIIHLKDSTYILHDGQSILGTVYISGKVMNCSFSIYGENYNDNAQNVSLSLENFAINYDLNDYFYNKLTFSKLKYEEPNTITLNLKKYSDTLEPFINNAIVKLFDHNYKLIDSAKINASGSAILSVIPSDTFPHKLIISNLIAKGQVDTFEIKVDYKMIKNVVKPKDLPVLKDTEIYIRVFDNVDTIKAISGLEVLLTDSQPGGFYFKGLTDNWGQVIIPAYLKSNRSLYLTIDGIGYVPYTSTIDVYLWSNTQDAFGKNNQEHIVRKPNTDEMEMVYTTGEDVVYGRSEDFGKIWELEVLGSGVDPVLVRTGSGLIAIWRNGISSYSYAIKSSPWTPSDTLVNPVIWLSEPVLGYNYTAGRTYIGYINNRYLQMERGDYILASMEELNTDDIYYDTVVSYRGEYNKVPMKSPVYSLYYNQLERNISHLIGFIDTSFQYVVSRYNIETKKWSDFEILNNLGQRCNAPVADYYGEVTTFGYEVMNVDNTRDIWVVKMVDGVIGTPERVNIYSGLNRNPKVRNNYLVSYVNNYNKIISQPGYGLTSLQNVVVLSGDSIYSYEVNMKETLLSKKALFAWTEGSNGEYRIKMKEVQYKGEVVPYIVSEPQDTIERVVTTPLYEYIPYKVPVERLNTTIDGLNPEMSYTIKVLTSDNNPVMAQVIEIDGEVYGVVRGGANRVDTTEIILPKEVYGDKRVVVSIDRKKGNPNRVAEVIVYQYEREGGVIAAGNEKEILAPVMNNDETEKKTKHVFTGKDEVYIDYLSSGVKDIEIEVYDVRGGMIKDWRREVKVGFNRVLLNGIENAGIYFVVIKSGGSKEIRKISIIK
ncbi:MAG: T9SS type A sorting domain-containing protein [candidate division WOR-3 bacterium]